MCRGSSSVHGYESRRRIENRRSSSPYRMAGNVFIRCTVLDLLNEGVPVRGILNSQIHLFFGDTSIQSKIQNHQRNVGSRYAHGIAVSLPARCGITLETASPAPVEVMTILMAAALPLRGFLWKCLGDSGRLYKSEWSQYGLSEWQIYHLSL